MEKQKTLHMVENDHFVNMLKCEYRFQFFRAINIIRNFFTARGSFRLL